MRNMWDIWQLFQKRQGNAVDVLLNWLNDPHLIHYMDALKVILVKSVCKHIIRNGYNCVLLHAHHQTI